MRELQHLASHVSHVSHASHLAHSSSWISDWPHYTLQAFMFFLHDLAYVYSVTSVLRWGLFCDLFGHHTSTLARSKKRSVHSPCL